MFRDSLDNYKFGELKINDLVVSHLHDKNGENWFDDNAGASLIGINVKTYKNSARIIEDEFGNLSHIKGKNLKTGKRGRPRRFVNFAMILMIAARSKSKEAMSIVTLAGELLNDMYNKTQGYTQPLSDQEKFNQIAKETIQYLEDMGQKNIELAKKSTSKKKTEEYINEANKYLWEARKAKAQRKNTANCTRKEFERIQANQRGELTESSDRPVFLPEPQFTLDDFKRKKTDEGSVLIPKTKKIQSKIDKWMDSDVNKSFSELAVNVNRRREKKDANKKRRLAKKNNKSQTTLI